MVVRVPDRDMGQAYLNEEFPGERCHRWLWHFLQSRDPNFALNVPGPNSKGEMGKYLINTDWASQLSRNTIDGGPGTDWDASWIEDSDLQTRFINNWIFNSFGSAPPATHPSLTGRSRAITRLDLLFNNHPEKFWEVGQLKTQWTQHLESYRVFDWFEGKEASTKCDFFWEWMRKKFPYRVALYKRFSDTQDVMRFFDEAWQERLEWKTVIADARKAWSQHLYRQKNQGKKQFNFLLSEETIKMLDGLAKKRNCSKAKVIEQLIKAASETSPHQAASQGGGFNI